jgi:hypothetical protein
MENICIPWSIQTDKVRPRKTFLDQIHDLDQKEISMSNATEPFGLCHTPQLDLISNIAISHMVVTKQADAP